MLRLSILLLFALQICAVFCRSTPFYKDETTDVELKGVTEITEDNKELNLQHGMLNGSVGLGRMAYDFYWTQKPWIDDYQKEVWKVYNIQMQILTYTAIAIGSFIFLSFVLGCILYVVCRKGPRRGIILSANRVPQEQPNLAATQNPAGPAGNLQMQPPTNQVYSAPVMPANQKTQALPPHSKPTQQQPPLYPVVQPVQQHPPEYKQNKENRSVSEFRNPVSLSPSCEDDEL